VKKFKFEDCYQLFAASLLDMADSRALTLGSPAVAASRSELTITPPYNDLDQTIDTARFVLNSMG